MSFPSGDAHWDGMLDQVRAIRSPNGITLAPAEFLGTLEDVRPPQFSFFMDPNEVETIVVHKGRMEDFHTGFLKTFVEGAHFGCGNAVLCAFSNSARAPAVRHDPGHLSIVFERFKTSVKDVVRDARQQSLGQSLGMHLRRLLPSRRREGARRYLLASANSFGNLGDDALTAMAEAVIREADPGADVVVTRPPPRRALVEEADVVVLGGGGLFYDAVFANALNYTQYLFWAREMNKPACAIGIGVQGIRTDLGRTLYREALAEGTLVTVRDENDRDVLVDQVGAQAHVEVARDLGFLVRPEGSISIRKVERPLLLFALADSSKLLAAKSLAGYQHTLESSLSTLKERFDVRFFVQSRDDRPLYERLAAAHGLEIIDLVGRPAGCALDVYTKADLVVTSRYHGVIFSSLAGVPTIPVGTVKGKVAQLVTRAMPSLRSQFIPAREFTQERLSATLRAFFEGQLAAAARDDVESCRRSAARNVELLQQTVLR